MVSLSNAIQEVSFGRKDKTALSQPVGLSSTKTPPKDGAPAWIKLNVQMSCGGDIFTDAITVPAYYDVPYFSNIQIDDGRTIATNTGPALGTGNGNGQAEASEKLMLYENGRRLRLYTDDPYVVTASEMDYVEMLPEGIWPDGFTQSSIIKIADNCPSGHTIEFFANYETKTRQPIGRVMHWGKVKITVK
jgi:hypothetical protein